MAETIWWCEFHRAGGDPELDCWGAGLDGQDDCDMVERELIDPANVDYEAAMRPLDKFLHDDPWFPHERYEECPDIEGELVALIVRAALGVGEPAEGSE